MDPRFRKPLVLLGLCLLMLLLVPQVEASAPIAKITAFKGEVLILSGTEFVKVTQVGVQLDPGDKVQTKQGEAEITFTDGSVMKMNPFTSAMVEEREEESGWWIFKSKDAVRRMTVYVGKLWFKSGASQRKNYLQTPTAVCGLRGSEAEVGFNNVQSLLNMVSGEIAAQYGEFLKGFFDNPGVDAATKNQVYQSLVAASQVATSAQASGSALDKAKAELGALQAIQTAAKTLQGSPDPAVAAKANEVVASTTVRIDETQKKIEQMPSTTVGSATTTVAPPTTSVVGETTTVAELTTTLSELTTTEAIVTTTTVPTIPITTTTTTQKASP